MSSIIICFHSDIVVIAFYRCRRGGGVLGLLLLLAIVLLIRHGVICLFHQMHNIPPQFCPTAIRHRLMLRYHCGIWHHVDIDPSCVGVMVWFPFQAVHSIMIHIVPTRETIIQIVVLFQGVGAVSRTSTTFIMLLIWLLCRLLLFHPLVGLRGGP